MGEQEREVTGSLLVFPDLMGEFEHEAAQAAGDGFCKGDAACILQCEAIFLADALDGAHLGFLVGAEKVKEAVALDRAQLRGRERLHGNLIDAVREHGVEAEDGAGAGDADDHLAIAVAAGGELEISAANEVEAARLFALREQRRLRGQGDGAGGEFEVRQKGAAQRAEPAGTAIGAGCAAYWNGAIRNPLPGMWNREMFCVRHGVFRRRSSIPWAQSARPVGVIADSAPGTGR